MNDNDRRIAAIHVEDEGKIGAVWISHCKISDVATIYDCCKFNNEVLAVISEGLNARGRWIPIAWEKRAKDVSDKLLSRGCTMLFEPVDETPFSAQMVSRDILERMRTGRFKVEKRLGEWTQEFNLFNEQEGQIPVGSFPLMAATRYAIACLDQGRRLKTIPKKQGNAPKFATI